MIVASWLNGKTAHTKRAPKQSHTHCSQWVPPMPLSASAAPARRPNRNTLSTNSVRMPKDFAVDPFRIFVNTLYTSIAINCMCVSEARRSISASSFFIRTQSERVIEWNSSGDANNFYDYGRKVCPTGPGYFAKLNGFAAFSSYTQQAVVAVLVAVCPVCGRRGGRVERPIELCAHLCAVWWFSPLIVRPFGCNRVFCVWVLVLIVAVCSDLPQFMRYNRTNMEQSVTRNHANAHNAR